MPDDFEPFESNEEVAKFMLDFIGNIKRDYSDTPTLYLRRHGDEELVEFCEKHGIKYAYYNH